MRISFTFVLLSLVAVAGAQDKNSPDPKLCSVSGIAIKEPGSQPLKKAILTLITDKQGEARTYTTPTDSDGHFTIENVPPGNYQVLLEKTGYVEINSRKHKLETRALTLSPGQHIDDLRLSMLMTSTIVGKVVDEDGDPLANAQVSAFRKRYGRSQWEQSNSERTNDLGEYRISGLFPGRYYLSATPAPDYRSFTNVQSRSAEQDSDSHLRQVTTFYPNTPDRNQASPIELRSGDELPINFTMVPSRTYAVRGVVVSLPSGKKAAVVLNAPEFGLVFNAAEVDKNGRFELKGVAPGSYNLTAFTDVSDGSISTAHDHIDVVSSDVNDVRLAPARVAKIAGQVSADTHKNLSQCMVWIRALDDDDHHLDFKPFGEDSSHGARANADGTFEIKDIAPGKYLVEVTFGDDARAYYVRSVRFNGSPADGGFTINGADGSLLVALSPDSAELKGSALDEHDKPIPDATVVLVPDESFRKAVSRYGKTHTDQNGRFTLRRITPGSYTVYAWQDLDGEPYLDPEFLSTQQDHGLSIHVNPGTANATVVLHAFPVPEDAN
jgi:protocatechuate 3,4-dioxygenase beta subunit